MHSTHICLTLARGIWVWLTKSLNAMKSCITKARSTCDMVFSNSYNCVWIFTAFLLVLECCFVGHHCLVPEIHRCLSVSPSVQDCSDPLPMDFRTQEVAAWVPIFGLWEWDNNDSLHPVHMATAHVEKLHGNIVLRHTRLAFHLQWCNCRTDDPQQLKGERSVIKLGSCKSILWRYLIKYLTLDL